MRKRILLLLLSLTLGCLLAGCAMPTVDQLYCVPRRPESYSEMQSVFDEAMSGLDYSAPRSGENLQTVQMEDLDGDGIREYLIFARDEGEKPLRILIFAQSGDAYSLVDTLECSGAYFDQVEYVQMDGKGGAELLVGTRISEQVYRSLGVYSFSKQKAQPVMTTSYVKYLTCDLDTDGLGEILVLRPGVTDADHGAASLCRIEEGMGKRSNEVALSCPVDKLSRILTGTLTGGVPGVFISGTDEMNAVLTDVITLEGGQLRNAALNSGTGTKMDAFGDYQVYPMDVDGDGQIELPALEKAREPSGALNQKLIRWYALAPDGSETNKVYAYHDYENGWYLELEEAWISALRISRDQSSVAFHLEDPESGQTEKIFSVYILTGQNREEKAVLENRFMLHKGENTIYAARLEVASGALSITQEDLISSFRLITQAWKSGEM